ncbi:Phage protein D [Actinopolymorpha cephalotaxi]|uniref:Phage protein D n=1 Tax=Actinopolymorpha cephalotaxi TaxID=504797 RepID=A0A1I3C5Y5_9ACTN|nr:hypothetical protein [Actinopolymorpha cephalotaxi]NYH85404.1 phage protein D [Actinopolymorpha cephalotaxi]SFH69411.1 Phage protein D [Actinopolymorpha cephalotaxi]
MKPTYQLSIGLLRATDAEPVGGPTTLTVDRAVDVPLDIARIRFCTRHDISLGANLTLRLGLGAAPVDTFTGTVAEVRTTLTGTSVLATGTMRNLMELRVAAAYSDVTVGTVARDLATRAGLAPADVHEGPLLPRFAVDVFRSGHEHLADLAHSFGLDLYADRQGRLVLRALPGGTPSLTGTAGAAAAGLAGPAAARYGADILTARGTRRPPSYDVVTVGGESPASTRGATAASWLTTDDQVARADAGSGAGSGSRRGLLLAPLARTRDLAHDIAEGQLRRASRSTNLVEVTVPGRPDLDLGDTLAVAAMPSDAPGGSGQVRALRHHLSADGGFTTTVRLALPTVAPEVRP